uniref:BAALC binder of MAP3K1 and KLF4 b n=1 Tax=Sinocyclocheilus grahami TaxID=75366 RepID=A0A672MS53_SINGR
MGCGGSRSATIEPRYYESRDTESTWLTSTDTETQRAAAGTGTGESATENDQTAAAAGAGQKEEKKLVNAGTQCGRNTSSTQRRPAHRDEVRRLNLMLKCHISFILNGIVHPKMNNCCKCSHPQSIQD